jgi:hypothetical protein
MILAHDSWTDAERYVTELGKERRRADKYENALKSAQAWLDSGQTIRSIDTPAHMIRAALKP